VTICTRERECLFGHAVNGEMRLNEAGEIGRRCWEYIPDHFPQVVLDAVVIIPNNVHGIIIVPGRGTACRAPTSEQFGKPAVGSVPTVVRSYKVTVTRLVRRRDDSTTNLGRDGQGSDESRPYGVWLAT
jgi:putative transposase